MTAASRRSTAASIGTAAFGLFVAGLAAFNRGFCYLHFNVAGRPLYVSELFLAVIAAFVLADTERRAKLAAAFTGARRWIFWSGALLFAFAIGKIALDCSRYGLEAVRQGALGYYILALPLAYVFFSDRWLRGWLLAALAVASAVSTAIFIGESSEWIPPDGTVLRQFHGLGAFVWIGLVSCYVLATGRADFWAQKRMTALFVLHTIAGFMLAGRSVFLGLAFAFAVILFFRRRVTTRHERVSIAVCAALLVAFVGLRASGVLRFSGQDTWKQSWTSYRQSDVVVERYASESSEKAATPAAPTKTNIPERPVIYDATRGILALTSARLNQAGLLGVTSASVNNVLWRTELWRLSFRAVMENAWVFGFPLGTTVHYYVFGDLMPGRVDLHNSHLAVLFRFGVIGFSLYALVLIASAVRFFRSAKAGDAMGLYFFAGLIFLVILASFNVLLEGPYGALTFWGFVGAGLAVVSRAAPEASAVDESTAQVAVPR